MLYSNFTANDVFVPSSYFRKYDKNNKRLCSLKECFKPVKDGRYITCSDEHSNEFNRWYCDHFLWYSIKIIILKRDNYTCQICKQDFSQYLNENSVWYGTVGQFVEFDHIIPKSKALDLHLVVKNPMDRYYIMWNQIIGNHNNLRTLCKVCHRKVTNEYMKEVGRKKRINNLRKKGQTFLV